MLRFKNIEISDIEILKPYLFDKDELACENTLVNMLVWQGAYNNMWAIDKGQLVIKSGHGEYSSYRLPFGDDLELGMALICEYSGEKYPKFWVQEGKRLNEFISSFGQSYSLSENRDAADYIYLQSDLSELSGKKYHSKRNHISAFSKRFEWEFKAITKENIPDVKKCAEKWYAENADRIDKYMFAEKRGIGLMLDNIDILPLRGGAIYVNGEVVAFTLGSPINGDIIDIHIEKALKDYAEGYTVINREFAKTLADYKYINREDDMGLEGLRKAKLSYKPHILLKKYECKKN